MAPSLRFSSLVLLAVSWMLAAGCGDDDTTTLAAGGSSGHSGTAGTAGAHAGSSGTHPSAAGAAGSSGSSGAAGSSGTDAGGAAGEGGEPTSSGGTSGGGTSGGTGGATAGTGGTAGAPNSVKNCAYQCATDDDCKVNGTDQGFSCNPISKRCEDVSACQVSSDCVAFANELNWFVPCADDTGCTAGTEACVAVGGGLCAPLPDPQAGCATGVVTQLAHFGATGNVQVCAIPGLCVNKTCQPSCTDPVLGACDGGTTCNAVTGLCECSASGQCIAASTPVCGADSHCGCATSDQCTTTAALGKDKCYSGSCGCSSASACPTSDFKNVTPVCE